MSFQVEDEDDGGRLVTFDALVTNDWGPRRENGKTRTLTTIHDWLYDEYLYRLPSRQFVRIRHRYNLNLSRTYTPTAKRFSDEEAAEWLLLGGFDIPDDIAHLADEYRFADVPASPLQAKSSTEPSEALRKLYHDPGNYWRNVWLYQLKKSGKTNDAILEALAQRGKEFETLVSPNALRRAIESIAIYHGWPQQKRGPGRPRSQA